MEENIRYNNSKGSLKHIYNLENVNFNQPNIRINRSITD